LYKPNFEKIDMKNLFVLLALVATLSACSKKQETPVSTSAPVAVPTASASDLPQECNDYLAKMQACMKSQSGASADAMKSSIEQTKASWASMGANKSMLGQACKAASDAFATQATAMKC
jgi:lipoprotein NlpI